MKNVLNKRVYLVNFWLLFTVGTVTAQTNPKTHDEGVKINGIKWATRNVDAPGTFAAKPEDPGMFYQWNRRVGWSATDPMVNSNGGTTWNSSNPAGSTWEKYNDPSPAGWRIPTKDEIDKLLDDTKVDSEWTEYGGVAGIKFTDKTSKKSIFLPAAGLRRLSNDPRHYDESADGLYWSSTAYESDETGAYFLLFYSDGTGGSSANVRRDGFSVRSVAE